GGPQKVEVHEPPVLRRRYPDERADGGDQPDQHARRGIRQRWPLPRGREACRRDWLASGGGPAVRHAVPGHRFQGGTVLRRQRHSFRILSERPRSGRPWNAPSTSHAGVGAALLLTPWSARSCSRETGWWPKVTTPNTADRIPRSSRSRPRARARAARRWWGT